MTSSGGSSKRWGGIAPSAGLGAGAALEPVRASPARSIRLDALSRAGSAASGSALGKTAGSVAGEGAGCVRSRCSVDSAPATANAVFRSATSCAGAGSVVAEATAASSSAAADCAAAATTGAANAGETVEGAGSALSAAACCVAGAAALAVIPSAGTAAARSSPGRSCRSRRPRRRRLRVVPPPSAVRSGTRSCATPSVVAATSVTSAATGSRCGGRPCASSRSRRGGRRSS